MKIWQLVDARTIGGIERHVATLVTALRRHGYDAEVVLLRPYEESPWRDQLRAEGVPHRTLGGSFSSMLTAIRESRPLLIHAHGYKASIFARFAAFVMRVPVVTTFHAGERAAYPVSMYQNFDVATSFMTPRIAVSAEIAQRIPWGAEVIRNFISVPNEVSDAPLPARVGFLGRLAWEKGADLFCEIAKRAPPGIEWHMWGDGPLLKDLQRTYGDCVRIHGLTLDSQAALKTLGLLAMPSRAEGLPMAALEALSASVPILASRVGGMPSLIRHGDNGWLFETGDIAGALEHLSAWRRLDAAQQIRIRHMCHSTVVDGYSDAAVLPVMLGFYRRAGMDAANSGQTNPTNRVNELTNKAGR